MPWPMVNVGDRVKIKGTLLDEEIDPITTQYLGCYGTVMNTDESFMHSILLDAYIDKGDMVFLTSELEVIRTEPIILEEGGVNSNMYQPITPQYILALQTLSVYEKLCYFVIHFENPADFACIMEYAGVTIEFAKTIVAKLMREGLVVEATKGSETFFAEYNIIPKKEKKEEEAKTTTYKEDKDLLLFQKALEKYYYSSAVNHKISKNGMKHIAKAVYFLEGQWAKKKDIRSLREFELKTDLYSAYIEYVFKGVDASDLNQLKRLTYSGTKKGWTLSLMKPAYKFDPMLIVKSFTKDEFFGIKKKEIPKDIVKSGYWSTYKIFLGSRWMEGTYPVSKNVLYALEMVIVYCLFRKAEPENITVGQLINIHTKYLKEYKRAVACRRLDNLADFVTRGAKHSDICFDCAKNDTCPTYNSAAIVVNCTQKVSANGA